MKEKINQIVKTSIVDFKVDKNYFDYFIKVIKKNINVINFKIFFNSFIKNNKLKDLRSFIKELSKLWVKENCKNEKIENCIFEYLSCLNKNKINKFVIFNIRVSIKCFYNLNKMFLLLNKIIDDKISCLCLLQNMVYSGENLINVAKYNNIKIDKVFFEKLEFFVDFLKDKNYLELYIENFNGNNSSYDLPDIFYYPATKIDILKQSFNIWEKHYSKAKFLEYILQYYESSNNYKRRFLFIFKELGIKNKEILLIPKNKRSRSINMFIEDLSKEDKDFAGYLYFD